MITMSQSGCETDRGLWNPGLGATAPDFHAPVDKAVQACWEERVWEPCEVTVVSPRRGQEPVAGAGGALGVNFRENIPPSPIHGSYWVAR